MMLDSFFVRFLLLSIFAPTVSMAALPDSFDNTTGNQTIYTRNPYIYMTFEDTAFDTLVLKEMQWEGDTLSAKEIEEYQQEAKIVLPAGATLQVTRAFYDEDGQSLLELKINGNLLAIVEESALKTLDFAVLERVTARRGAKGSAGAFKGRITSGVGYRRDPFTHARKFHRGTDYAMPVGTPVHSRTTGVVTKAGNGTGYGRVVYVQGGGYLTIYAHLSKISVRTGQKVNSGDLLGKSGCSGRCSGPHLHYEQRRG